MFLFSNYYMAFSVISLPQKLFNQTKKLKIIIFQLDMHALSIIIVLALDIIIKRQFIA